MFNWVKKLIHWDFSKKPSAPYMDTPARQTEVTNDKPFEPTPLPAAQEQRTKWVMKCLAISQSFEGTTPYANITGNFDGMGLTCGALGWTFGYGDQQRLVREFVTKHGKERLFSLMPKYGPLYLEACFAKQSVGFNTVSAWSKGANVFPAIKKELETFWQSIEMVDIQVLEATRTIGAWAFEQLERISWPKDKTFRMFAWYFDTRVLNGSTKGVILKPALAGDTAPIQYVVSSAGSWSGYNKYDLRRNLELWIAKRGTGFSAEQCSLFYAAYERAALSRREFRGTTLCRRGTLSLDVGYVNGELRRPYDEVGMNPNEVLT